MHRENILSGHASFGVDIGHSSTKIKVALLDAPTLHHATTIPTVVIRAFDLRNEKTAGLAIRDTVTVDGVAYFFGKTAIAQSNPVSFSGENKGWIDSYVHDVLIVASWQRAMSLIECNPAVVHFVVGLPTAFFTAQKKALVARVTELLASYLAPGQVLKVIVQEQSVVPLQNIQHTPDGWPDDAYDEETTSYAVIEIGHGTTDFAILQNDQFQDIGGDSIAGASIAYAAIRTEFISHDYGDLLSQVDRAIKTGKIPHWGAEVDVSDIVAAAVQPLCDAIIDRAKMLLGKNASALNGIIVSGGIAPLLIERIQGVFPNAVLDADPSMAIAEGLCRFGLFAHHCAAA